MASLFNEQPVLGIRIVPDGTAMFNGLPVHGVVDAGALATFVGNQRVRGVDVLTADKAVHNDQPVLGVVLILDARKLYNNQLVIPVRAISGVLA